uniref:Mediator of RNA polymerase II transcription subunit 6 n=1 Tax=Schistocephalus solidus TaxID=70667 RepID=A0A0X3Q7S5_SCHSO
MSPEISAETDSLYEVSWANPLFSPHLLCAANVLEYFCDLSNPFYDRECNNEVIRMQKLSPEQLVSMTGIEFYLHHSQEPVLFVIRKQQRLSPTLVTPIAYYYIVNGTVIQAPDLATLVNARLHTVIYGLNKTIQTLAPCARYHPPDGSYSWDDPKKLLGRSTREQDDDASEGKSTDAQIAQKSESNVATNYYQVHPMQLLLAEWASRFPLPPLPATTAVQTPQQPTATTPQTQSGPLAQHAASAREHELKSGSGVPEKKSRLL